MIWSAKIKYCLHIKAVDTENGIGNGIIKMFFFMINLYLLIKQGMVQIPILHQVTKIGLKSHIYEKKLFNFQ